MKKGDKVYCKNSFSFNIGMIEASTIEHEYYYVNSYDRVHVNINLDYDNKNNMLTQWFSIDKDDELNPFFGDYFYTKKDLRKAKIKQINENNL